MNPFNPGAGRKPPYLAGRDNIIRAIKADMQQVYDNTEGTRPIVISGLRGMGKTVFLREIAEQARSQSWVVVWVEASKNESLAKKLSQATYLELRKLLNSSKLAANVFSHAIAVLKSFQLKIDPSGTCSFGFDIKPAAGYADSGDLSLDLTDLFLAMGEAAREAGTAVLICIDELQEASSLDLSALNIALHTIGQGSSPVPVYFAGAGLPTLPSVLAEATSYAERMYQFHQLDLLDTNSVKDAYVEPTAKSKIEWEPEALDAAINAADGYPYFIQQCGFCICEQVVAPCKITKNEAEDGILIAKNELDRGLYRSRWDRATAKGKEMMTAMAEDKAMSKLSEVAKRMGKQRASDLSVLRDKLITDGLIYSPERGYVAFTAPGMDEFIKRNVDTA